jgi:hypothetical protein
MEGRRWLYVFHLHPGVVALNYMFIIQSIAHSSGLANASIVTAQRSPSGQTESRLALTLSESELGIPREKHR